MKRTITCLLLCAMLISAASCGSSGTQTETSADAGTTQTETEDTVASGRLNHSVPRQDFGGEKFNIVYPKWQGYRYYFFADEANGDIMNDAIYERTMFIEEYLNVDLVQEEQPDLKPTIEAVTKSVAAGDDTYQLALIHCIEGVASLPTGGYLYNLDDLPYLNMDADWWNREQMDVLRLGNNTYYGVSDYMIPSPYVVFFNKNMVEDNKLDNPYELVYDGKWTLDKLVEMAISVVRDLNSDGIYDLNDICGIAYNEESKFIPFMTAAGQFVTKKGNDGQIELALNNEKTVSIVETLYKLVETDGSTYRKVGSFAEKDVFPMDSGRLLFRLADIGVTETYRTIDVDTGIVPYPKYDEAQENYISQDWGGLMCVPTTIGNPEMVGSVIELLSWSTAEKVLPAYFDVTLAGKFARDEDTRNMLELVFDTIAYEVGGNYFGFATGFNQLFYTMPQLVINGKSSDFASWYATYAPSAQSTIENFYEQLGEIEK